MAFVDDWWCLRLEECQAILSQVFFIQSRESRLLEAILIPDSHEVILADALGRMLIFLATPSAALDGLSRFDVNATSTNRFEIFPE